MTTYLIELFNMFTAFAVGFPFLLCPMWKTRDISKKFVYIYIAGFAVLISTVLLIVRQYITIDMNTIQGLKLCFLVPQFILPIIAFRKRIWQVVFLITLTNLYYLTYTGISNFLTEMLAPENPLFCAAIISNILIIITFPPLAIMLRRLYSNNDTEYTKVFWRLAWIVPASFHMAIFVQGSYVTSNDFGSWFLIIRILAYALSLVVCFLFDVMTRKISEAEATRHESERRAMEAELRERTLAADNAALDRLNRMKNDIIDTISHESRTPLAVLASYAGLLSMELREKDLGEQASEDLDTIASEASRVANLIDSLRKLSQQKETTAQWTVLDIGEILRQTVRLYGYIVERGGIALETDIPDSLPSVTGSPEELTQVVFNLLQNAKSHTESGNISVSARYADNAVAVTVSDTGSGIAPELLPRVFERGVTGTKGGAGLGLSICKEIIKNHGGEIKIESEPGKRTAVTFSLPAHKEGC